MRSAPHVLLYSDATLFGGAERYLVELARGIGRERFALSAVVARQDSMDPLARSLSNLGLNVHRLPPVPTLSARGAFLAVLRFLAFKRPAIIHWNLGDPRSCNGAMTAAALSAQRRFVVTEHLPESPFDNGRLPFRHRIAMRRTAATIVFSKALRQVVESRPHNRSQVVVIPNGIPDPGAPTPEQRALARAAMGLEGHRGPIVGLVGRLQPQKNPELFLEGVRRVVPVHPEARFVIMGEGPARAALTARVQELQLEGQVCFLGWRADAQDLMAGLDLLVNTSRFEGQPISILEALLREVPVVAPRLAGMEEVVADQACGRVIPPGDGEVLGQTLNELLADRELLASLGRAGRARVGALFSLQGMCHATADLYDRLLDGTL